MARADLKASSPQQTKIFGIKSSDAVEKGRGSTAAPSAPDIIRAQDHAIASLPPMSPSGICCNRIGSKGVKGTLQQCVPCCFILVMGRLGPTAIIGAKNSLAPICLRQACGLDCSPRPRCPNYFSCLSASSGNAGPGSVLRPAVMSECPRTAMSGCRVRNARTMDLAVLTCSIVKLSQ